MKNTQPSISEYILAVQELSAEVTELRQKLETAEEKLSDLRDDHSEDLNKLRHLERVVKEFPPDFKLCFFICFCREDKLNNILEAIVGSNEHTKVTNVDKYVHYDGNDFSFRSSLTDISNRWRGLFTISGYISIGRAQEVLKQVNRFSTGVWSRKTQDMSEGYEFDFSVKDYWFPQDENVSSQLKVDLAEMTSKKTYFEMQYHAALNKIADLTNELANERNKNNV